MFRRSWQFFVVGIAGWLNRQQQEVIEYLREENRVLREKLGPGRIILNVAQKRRLATAAAKLGRSLLKQVCTLFSPDTLLKWHRWLIARKYDSSGHRGKKTKQTKADKIREHVIRMATENPSWGVGRIHGEIKKLGFTVSWWVVRSILLENGLLHDPDNPRTMKWGDFLRTHWESMAACDSFAVEAWTKGGLVRFLVFFVVHLASRRVHIAGIHADPAEPQMLQMARNLTDCDDGFLKDKWYLIQDRDPLYTRRFRATLRATGVRSVRLPKWSPNLNCFAERFVLSARQECLDKIIFFGERHLRYVIEQYVQHYNTERPHQGLDNERIDGEPLPTEGEVQCRERLGGLLKSYYREAA